MSRKNCRENYDRGNIALYIRRARTLVRFRIVDDIDRRTVFTARIRKTIGGRLFAGSAFTVTTDMAKAITTARKNCLKASIIRENIQDAK
jgi:regulator of RNase E activity RraA